MNKSQTACGYWSARKLILAALLPTITFFQSHQAAQADGLNNVSLVELGATGKGSGAPFNKDWPPNNALMPDKGRGGFSRR